VLTRIWDWLFTRKIWAIEKEVALVDKGVRIGTRYVLKDQFGNLKQKDVW